MTVLTSSNTTKQQIAISVLVIIATLIAIGMMFGKKADIAPLLPANAVPGAEFITAKQETLTIPMKVRGIIEPEKQLTLVSQVIGTVTHINRQFAAGGSFKKGDVLLQADTAYLNLELQKARSVYAQTVLHEQEVKAHIEAGIIVAGNPDNSSELARGKPQLDAATSAREAALATVQLAEKQMANTTVRAPFNGRVMTRNIQEQEQLIVGRPLGQIYSTDAYIIRFPLTQEQFSLIATTSGNTLSENRLIISNEITQQQWRGVILRSEGFIAANRMIYVVAEVLPGKNPLSDLVPGSLLQIDLQSKPFAKVIALPISALQENTTAWVIAGDNRVQRRALTILHRGPDYAYINTGLDDNDRVLVKPISGIREGMPVHPLPAKTTMPVTIPDSH